MTKMRKYHIGVLFLSVVAVIFLVWAVIATAFNFTSKNVEIITPIPRSKSDRYSTTAIVSDSGLCAEISRNVIIQGGNAVDAAIAATFCNGVVLPYATGLGGGGFMIVYLKDQKKCIFLNSRETAPSSSHQNMYSTDKEAAQFGYKSVATPGELHGLWTAYQRYGSKVLPWSELVLPAARLARGFPNHAAMTNYFERINRYSDRSEAQRIKKAYTDPATGEFYKPGDLVANMALARTLELIAESSDPVQLFYGDGILAQTILNEMNQNGGHVSASDLQNYTTDITEALYSDLAGYRMCGPPPPSSWAITQAIPRIVENAYYDRNVFNDAPFYHTLVEAEKLAYGQRGSLDEVAGNLTGKHMIRQLAKMIPKTGQSLEYYMRSHPAREDAGTSHTSIIDDDGNAVAVTSSINMAFGSKMMSRLGFIYNNQMDDFSTPGLVNHWGFRPSASNFIRPGRRPMSSMSPTVIFDEQTGSVKMVTGATGGSKIISATAQTIVRGVLLQQTAAEIVEHPRIHNQLTPLETFVEDGFSEKIREKLEGDYGQNIRTSHEPLAITYPITRDGDFYTAAADFRRRSNNQPAGW